MLKPIHPNAGTSARYDRKLQTQVDAMARGILTSVSRQYRANVPTHALDASPAAEMRAALRALSRRWLKQFDELAPALAQWFADQSAQHVDSNLRAQARDHSGLMALLRKGGFTVRFKLSAGQRDVLSATVAENVSLIRSIPEQHLKSVEGIVMRGVSAGYDLAQIREGLEKQHGVTKRRATNIAISQANLATAMLTRTRQLELGITEAIWSHSAGGKTPRPTHVAHNGKRYDVRKGWLDPAINKYIWPGTEPRCRCASAPYLPGFDD